MQVNVSELELSHFKSQGQRKTNKVTLSPKNSDHVIESEKTNKVFVQKKAKAYYGFIELQAISKIISYSHSNQIFDCKVHVKVWIS